MGEGRSVTTLLLQHSAIFHLLQVLCTAGSLHVRTSAHAILYNVDMHTVCNRMINYWVNVRRCVQEEVTYGLAFTPQTHLYKVNDAQGCIQGRQFDVLCEKHVLNVTRSTVQGSLPRNVVSSM